MSSGGQQGMDKLFSIILGLVVFALILYLAKKSGHLDTVRDAFSILRGG